MLCLLVDPVTICKVISRDVRYIKIPLKSKDNACPGIAEIGSIALETTIGGIGVVVMTGGCVVADGCVVNSGCDVVGSCVVAGGCVVASGCVVAGG